MVKNRLEMLESWEWDNAKLLGTKIRGLEPKNLRKIKSSEEIEKICDEVISAVANLMLVHIDEWMLETRKPKKWKYLPQIDIYRWEEEDSAEQNYYFSQFKIFKNVSLNVVLWNCKFLEQ